MAETPDAAELEDRLFDEIEKSRFGMLGAAGDGGVEHLQPMTAYLDREARLLWFFTRRSTDLAREALAPRTAIFCLMSKDQEFQASVIGELTEDRDPAKIDAYWNRVAAAWFPEGKEDPELTLLRFAPADAQVWRSRAGPLRFALEIAKANATGEEPNLGDKGHFTLI